MGGLFGGGSKSTVTQKATNQTSIDLTNQVANIIDITALAEVLKKSGEETRTLIASLSKAQVVAQLVDAKAKMDQNEILKTTLKYSGIGIIALAAYKGYKNGK